MGSRIAIQLGVALITAFTAACGATSAQLSPSASLTTLMAGWERHFALEWTVEPGRDDTRRIRGYVRSQHGEFAEPVRLLGRALDPSGAVLAQQIVWVLGGVGGFGHGYFEVDRMPVAASYQVTVWHYTFLQSDTVTSSSGGRR